MLRLIVLGSLDLAGPDGVRYRDFLAKPKRVALLVYLAVTRPWRYHRRDSLAALFWPELDQASARRALRQGLYVIRHDLLPDLVVSRGDEEVAFDPERLRCDALEFEAALDDGDPAGAFERYRGDFLAGFHLSNTPELERWIEDQRARLKARAVGAAASAARSAGDQAMAIQWLRRGLALAPDDENLLRSLVTALDRGGDRPGAIRAFDEFARRLRDDLGLEPSAETRALLDQIKSRRDPPGRPLAPRLDPVPDPPPAPIPVPAAIDESQPAPRGPQRPVARRLLTAGVVLAALVVSGIWLAGSIRNARSNAGPVRLVVLPFENVGAPSTEYFADGLTEEIATRLARIAGLAVTAPSTAARYKRSTRPAAAIGRELGVDYLLEGTIRWDSAGGTSIVRVNPQLIRVADTGFVWAEPYQEPLASVFALQAEIAERVAAALEVRLARPEREAVRDVPTRNAEAHGFYLRARESYHQATARWDESPSDLAISERWLERAVELDSTFALAWAELGRLRLIRWRVSRNDASLLDAGRAATERALAIQPDLAEALVVTGMIEGDVLRRWEQAARRFEDALRHQPSNADALAELAWTQAGRRQWLNAMESMDRAAALDPASAGKASDQALLASWAGRPERGAAAFRRAIALNPSYAPLYLSAAHNLTDYVGDSIATEQVLQEAESRFGRLELIRLACLSCLFQTWWGPRYADLLDSLSLDDPVPPDSGDWYTARGNRARLKGDSMGARASWDSAVRVSVGRSRARPNDTGLRRRAAYSLLASGRREEGMRELSAALSAEGRRGGAFEMTSAGEWAFAHLDSGELEAAVDSFAVAIRDPDERLLTRHVLRSDPRLASLRRIPKFRDLLR